MGLIVTNVKSQIDTTGILNNLVLNKSIYLYQPLSKLISGLGSLKIDDNSCIIPTKLEPDTIYFEYMNLYFNENVLVKQNPLKPTFIRVKFIAALPLKKYYFSSGNILDCDTKWNIKKELYFGQFIISDFTIH